MAITGLGPHGEQAVPPHHLRLTHAEAELARKCQFTVAVVLHTTSSDWSKQQIAGIVATLGEYSAAVIDVVDCGFSEAVQNSALDRLTRDTPDAIISIPIGNAAVADGHRSVSRAGVKLILLDNAPTGLLPGKDYVSVVSADNFGLGQIGAELLSPYVEEGASIGIISYGVDFFVTNQREIAFRKWMETERPDIRMRSARFIDVNLVAPVVDGVLAANADIQGLFAVWDEPAMQAVAALKSRGRQLPLTTVDLGNEAALELGSGGMIKGIGAQRPYDQGVTAAVAALQVLVGRSPSPWVASPGLSVTRRNVLEAYQLIWHSPAPQQLISARQRA